MTFDQLASTNAAAAAVRITTLEQEIDRLRRELGTPPPRPTAGAWFDRPITISDACPASDHLPLRELRRLAASRPPVTGRRKYCRSVPAPELRCREMVHVRRPETGVILQAPKKQCSRPHRGNGYCYAHQTAAEVQQVQ